MGGRIDTHGKKQSSVLQESIRAHELYRRLYDIR